MLWENFDFELWSLPLTLALSTDNQPSTVEQLFAKNNYWYFSLRSNHEIINSTSCVVIHICMIKN